MARYSQILTKGTGVILLLSGQILLAGDFNFEWKTGVRLDHFSTGSVQTVQQGESSEQLDKSFRLKYQHQTGAWQFDWQYQLALSYATDPLSGWNFDSNFDPHSGPNTETTVNLFDIQSSVDSNSASAAINQVGLTQWQFSPTKYSLVKHGLERASVGYTTQHWVFRLGRQSISWGNANVFQTFDLFNPFSPATVDTSYKPGADMFYSQYLFDSGGDIQFLWVPRGATNDNRKSQNFSEKRASKTIFYHNSAIVDAANQGDSLALKSLHYWGSWQTEFLVAKDFDNRVLGISLSIPLGDSLLKWDTTNTNWHINRTDFPGLASVQSSPPYPRESVWQSVINWQYSWQLGDRPASGFVEYYFNQLSVDDDLPIDLSTLSVSQLLALSRGQLFSLRQDNLAMGMQWQISENQILSPTLLVSPGDDSWLLMTHLQWDVSDSANLLIGFLIADGNPGSQYGGAWLDQAGGQVFSPTRRVWFRYEYYW